MKWTEPVENTRGSTPRRFEWQRSSCRFVQARITALRQGWLTAEERERTERHLARCSNCARQLDLDQRLCSALESMPSVVPAPVPEHAWIGGPMRQQAPKAAPGTSPHYGVRSLGRRFLVAFATVATGACFFFVWWYEAEMPVDFAPAVVAQAPTHPREHSGESDMSYAGTTRTMSLSDAAADPNRVVLLTAVSSVSRNSR